MKAEIFGYTQWISETDPANIKSLFDKTLKECGFNVLGFMEHHFDPQGYTSIWLLAESHFAVHTFPEHGKSYIELSSCNEEKHWSFIESDSLADIIIYD